MGVATGVKATGASIPRMRATAGMRADLLKTRSRLVDVIDQAQRLGRMDAAEAAGFVRDAINEIDRAVERLDRRQP